MSTTDDQLRQLDQRAAAATTDLHTRAEARSDPAKVITTQPRPYLATEPPDGFELAGAGEITPEQTRAVTSDGEPLTGPGTLYGPDEEDPQLGVAVLPAPEGDTGFEAIDLGGGRTAYDYSGLGIGEHALALIEADRSVLLVSPSLSTSELQDLAATVEVDDDGRIEPGSVELPDGWREVHHSDEGGIAGSAGELANPTSVGTYVLYMENGGSIYQGTSSDVSGPDGSSVAEPSTDPAGDAGEGTDAQGNGLLSISSKPGDEADVYAHAVTATSSSRTTVRGHDALLTTSEILDADDGQDPMRSVIWLERPGEVVEVFGTGIDEKQLLASANSLEAIGPADWKDLLERSQLGELDPANRDDPPKLRIGEGRFPDGSRWILTVSVSEDPMYPDPTVHLSVAVADPGNSSSSSGGGTASMLGGQEERAIRSIETVGQGSKNFAGALLSDAVARVELRAVDGTVLAEPEIVEDNGYRGVALPLSTETAILVALGADGRELGREELTQELSHDEPSEGSPAGEGESGTTVVTGSGSSSSSGSSSGSGSGGSGG